MTPATTRHAALVLALGLLASAPGQADAAEVIVTSGRVEVDAAGTPLAEVLQKLAAVTGMKLVIEGPAPRQPLRAHIVVATPAEAVLALLEGQGLSYALLYDASGTRVDTLLLTGPAGSAPAASATRATPPTPVPQRGRPALPPAPVDEESDPDFEEPPEEPVEPDEATPQEPAAVEPEAPAAAPTPLPAPRFPRSPFTPGPEAAPLFPVPPSTTPPPPAAPSPTPQSR